MTKTCRNCKTFPPCTSRGFCRKCVFLAVKCRFFEGEFFKSFGAPLEHARWLNAIFNLHKLGFRIKSEAKCLS